MPARSANQIVLSFKDNALSPIVTTGLVPVVHAAKDWIAGTGPAMTKGRGSVSGQS